MARAKQIRDPKDFPQDFWNYLVNPILGYYVKPASKVWGKRDKKDE